MHPLLRFTLDLFEPPRPVTPKVAGSRASGVLVPASPSPSPELHPADELAGAAFRHPRATRQACLAGGALVAYEFKRSTRRTIGFSVGPEGLVVRAPKWVPLQQVEAALQEKSHWIVRKLGETRERHARRAAHRIEWRDGACLLFLGEPLTLVLDPRHAAGPELHIAPPGRRLLLGLPPAAGPEQIREVVQGWWMHQARHLFSERLDYFAPRLQVQWRALSLSNARTRWGSARSDGAIRLNWRLLHFRSAIIDYVVAHELSHLRVMDHSPRFWATVGSVVPDYGALRRQLKDDAVPHWS